MNSFARFLFALFCCILLFQSPLLAQSDPRRTPVVEAVEKVGSAVVNISTLSVQQTSSPFVIDDPFFNEFFRDFFPGFGRSYETQSLGSGVIIDCRGHILTNAHVVAGATAITIFTSDNREHSVRVLGSDTRSDIAVLAMENPPTQLTCANPGDSSNLLIGEPVIAIGNPFGFSSTVTTGIISAVGRSIRDESGIFHNLIQTDTMINPGNSGGPLLNIHGDVIGINTAIYRRAQGIGFSIPIDRAMRIYDYILQHGTVHRAWIGVEVQPITAQLHGTLNRTLPRGVGVMVSDVSYPSHFRGEPLRRRDVILEVGSMPIGNELDYVMGLFDYTANDLVELTVLRDSEVFKTKVQAQQAPTDYGRRLLAQWLGIELGQNYSENGVEVQRIHSRSWAQRAGFRPGDRIVTIDDQQLDNPQSLAEALTLAKARGKGIMEVARGRQTTKVQFQGR
ncbi:trypsin-like peptidase domain-containing protein [Desulfurispira natronophila]|uniref:Serine protease Do n=1 Tax=Desulfurispira natronophila TaxID=682562 RepID=A0A7W7Y2W0_9BACT|nr:trypsin-like peptidase domain-containing protein [Desulfurispira natronophila]MBB5021100.1 serine protease Do [Desulfurispira natronophila]